MNTVLNKRARHFVLLVGLVLPLWALAALQWETKRLEFKPHAGEKEVVGEFHFQNTGTEPVEIRDIQTSCECTTAELPQRIYAPGESGVIKAVVNLGDGMGTIERTVTLRTEERVTQFVTLALRIEIPELLTYSARTLRWSVGGSTEAQSIDINASAGIRLTSIEVKDITPRQATARIEAIEAGSKYRLSIQPDQVTAPRTVTVTCIAQFTDGAKHSFQIYALVR